MCCSAHGCCGVECGAACCAAQHTAIATLTDMAYGSTYFLPMNYLPALLNLPEAQDFMADDLHSLPLAKSQIAKAQEWQKSSNSCKHQYMKVNVGD